MKFFRKNWKQKLVIFLIVFAIYNIAVTIYEWHAGCSPEDITSSVFIDRISCSASETAMTLVVFPLITLLGFILFPLILITHLIMPNFTYPFGWIGLSFGTFLMGDSFYLFLGLVITLLIAYSLYFLLSFLKQPKKQRLPREK